MSRRPIFPGLRPGLWYNAPSGLKTRVALVITLWVQPKMWVKTSSLRRDGAIHLLGANCARRLVPEGSGLNSLRKKATNNVILRRQQAPKNLHLLENIECRSFAPKSGAQDDSVGRPFSAACQARRYVSQADLPLGYEQDLSFNCLE
jgi:hypothetical protein